MRESVETLIDAFGLCAEVYSSGEDFLKVAAESEAACLIVDIGLEDMTGIERGRRLARMGLQFPIIFRAAKRVWLTKSEQLQSVGMTPAVCTPMRRSKPAGPSTWCSTRDLDELDRPKVAGGLGEDLE